MLQTTLTCGKCGSADLRKNGSRHGQPNYQCKACRYQALFEPAAARKAAQYAQVEKLLVERVSQRAIVRLTGVARPTIVKLAKKAHATPRLRPKPSRPRVLELDEMWTFVGHKGNKVWLWLAVERASRRIVAWVLGERRRATAQRLWEALPESYRTGTWYYPDEWEAYRGVFAAPAHCPSPKGSGQTSVVEAINYSFRSGEHQKVWGNRILRLAQGETERSAASLKPHCPTLSDALHQWPGTIDYIGLGQEPPP